MNLYKIILPLCVLALASCGTAYQAGQTPDAVYYTPTESQQSYAQNTSNIQNGNIAATDEQGGNYVVYDDGSVGQIDYREGYGDGYSDGFYRGSYSPMFGGGLYPYNYYNSFDPWFGVRPFGYSSFGYSRFYNPYMWSPGLSISLGWGMPLAYSRWYDPFSPYYGFGYRPFGYSSLYYGGYYGGYFPGYYGGYGYGHGTYLNYTPRPAASYGPRGAMGSPAANGINYGGATRTANGVSAPRRVFSTRDAEGIQQPEGDSRNIRRVFSGNEEERSVPLNNNNGRSTQPTERPTRRLFQPRASETPIRANQQSSSRETRTSSETRRISPPQQESRRIFRSAPTQQTSPSYQQPTRTYSAPSRSSSSSNSSSGSTRSTSTPSRSYSPRR